MDEHQRLEWKEVLKNHPLQDIHFKKIPKIILNEPGVKEDLLMRAIEEGSFNLVKELLDEQVNVNERRHQWTPLLWAIEKNQTDCACLLMDAGAHLNSRNLRGEPPLIMAVKKNNERVVLELLKKGVDVNQEDNHGRTALTHACLKGWDHWVSVLTRHGANLNVKDDLNVTPLICAAKKGHLKTVQALIQEGVDVHQIDQIGRNALMVAIADHQEEIVLELIPHQRSLEAKTIFWETPLLYAGYYNVSMVCFNRLIEAGGRLDEITKDNQTIWTKILSSESDDDLIEAKIEAVAQKGLRVDELNRYGETVMMALLKNKNRSKVFWNKMLDFFEQKGLNPQHVSQLNQTLLGQAIERHHELVEVLMQRDLDWSAPKVALIALIGCVRAKNLEMFKAFIHKELMNRLTLTEKETLMSALKTKPEWLDWLQSKKECDLMKTLWIESPPEWNEKKPGIRL